MEYSIWVGMHSGLRMTFWIWTPELQAGLPPDVVRFASFSTSLVHPETTSRISGYSVLGRMAARSLVHKVKFEPDFKEVAARYAACLEEPEGSYRRPKVPPYVRTGVLQR